MLLVGLAGLLVVVGVIVGVVMYTTRGPTAAQRISSHPIQLGVPFRFVLAPADTNRHALWLEAEVHFEGDEAHHYGLHFAVSYDGNPTQAFRVPSSGATGRLVSQHGRAVATGMTRLSFLRPRPVGATISVEGVMTASENVQSANLSLLFTRWK